ncbi:hypothetical protein GOBAR_AA39756 [Gossypium barbadense]|uniref:Uncharacterized protein n=1 Tax=Gossypium barbadense TaxID=3634 RepID=A0A2P5VQ52_GOSBA|nr:hypothetical protein GOBAR_AA39756 [Gossypium barbadense]
MSYYNRQQAPVAYPPPPTSYPSAAPGQACPPPMAQPYYPPQVRRIRPDTLPSKWITPPDGLENSTPSVFSPSVLILRASCTIHAPGGCWWVAQDKARL